MTMKFSDIVPSKLAFTEVEENTRSKGQRIAYPRYDGDKPLLIQMPWVMMDTMGVPSICEYYPDDSKRDFVKIPLDQNVPEIKELTEKLMALDEHVGSTELREKLFGDKASKYEYQPIIRTQEEQETKKDAKFKRPHYPYYMKVKLDTTYPDYKIKTEVFLSEMKEDKRTRTKVDLSTIDEMAKQVWLHKIRAVIQGVKLWAQPPNKKSAGYGLTFKMKRVEVEPTRSGGAVKSANSDAFLDSDNEDEEQTTVQTTAAKPAASVTKKVESDDEESDDEPKKVAPVKATKQVAQASSDEESDDEPVVKKPAAKKTVKQVVAEASSDEESDDEPVVKKTAAKGSKFSVSKSKKASA